MQDKITARSRYRNGRVAGCLSSGLLTLRHDTNAVLLGAMRWWYWITLTSRTMQYKCTSLTCMQPSPDITPRLPDRNHAATGACSLLLSPQLKLGQNTINTILSDTADKTQKFTSDWDVLYSFNCSFCTHETYLGVLNSPFVTSYFRTGGFACNAIQINNVS